MSVADRLEAAAAPVAKLDLGPDGGEFSNVRSHEPITNWDDVLRNLGVDPDFFMVVGESVRVSSWDQSKRTDDGDRDVVRLYSYSGHITTRREAIDLPALYAASRRKRSAQVQATTARVTVVALADVQIGKTGARGGTPELIERLADKRDRLAKHLARVKPSATVLAEVGDLFENFESGGNPMFTNDLSLAQQMDLAGTEVFEFLSVMQKYGHVDVMAVTSNHTSWRRGSLNLGNPQDDLGLFVHRQVEKVAHAAGVDATWHVPPPFSEAVTLDVSGTVLGMVHGNQYTKTGAVKWWQGQQHGGQPVGAADILLTGHYHVLSVNPTGRNPYTGRSKWHIQAPTLDAGSDWYRNRAGEDSDPGLLVFDITENGFDLQSLTVL